MKNVIKKISAIAMAFTLLSTGTAAIKTIVPQTDNTIIASAAGGECNHAGSWSSWRTTRTEWGFLIKKEYQERTYTCIRCGHHIKTEKRHRNIYFCEERTIPGSWIYD